MIVLGVDPGIARLGYGIVRHDGPTLIHVAHGCLETPKTMGQSERLSSLHEALVKLLETHRPDLVGVEKLFFQKNVKTAMGVSEARGVILLAMQNGAVPLSEFTPGQIKIAVTGHGGADKRQVQAMIKRLMGLKEVPKPDDAADALAIAYCAAVSVPGTRR